MNPKVSVLIPSYNHGKFLQEAMCSVLNQSMSDLELLVLDDGSKDDSYEIAQQVAATDSRVRVMRQSNVGVVSTLNRLAASARGDFVTHLGSDDVLLPHRLAWGMEDMLNNPGLSATFCDLYIIDADSKPTMQSVFAGLPTHQGADVAQRLVAQNVLGALTAFIRRAALNKVGDFARPFNEIQDWDLWLRLALVGDLKWRAGVGALYRQHGDNMSSQNPVSSSREQLRVLQEISPLLIDKYGLPSRCWNDVYSRKAHHAYIVGDYPLLLTTLLEKNRDFGLEELEHLRLIEAFARTGRYNKAMEVIQFLASHKNSMKLSHIQLLDAFEVHMKDILAMSSGAPSECATN